ncbi:MAG: hypothetical protein NC905_06710, partial [Candidatus Omnitrophica bacterium]|nr:hypothetical protein [Candidatus Omnitrophota bacterium]
LFEAYSLPYQSQSAYGRWDGSSNYGLVHLAHLGRCNVAFADGHVESLNAAQLKSYGFIVGCQNRGIITF